MQCSIVYREYIYLFILLPLWWVLISLIQPASVSLLVSRFCLLLVMPLHTCTIFLFLIVSIYIMCCGTIGVPLFARENIKLTFAINFKKYWR